MKVVLHFRSSAALQARIAAKMPSWIELVFADDGDPSGLPKVLKDTSVLLHVLSPVTAEIMAAAPSLQLIQKIGVGVNTIDLDDAARRGIRITNMPGTNSRAVAEATLTLMLCTLRRLVPLDSATRTGDGWSLPADATDDIGELYGRTVGLIGFGAVPRLLVKMLEGLGAQVQFWSRSPVKDAPVPQVDWDTLLQTSNIVSLHVPLTAETRHLIDEAALARMGKGAILINTARGPVVDEAAFYRALANGHLRGAGIDVFEQEPTPRSNPLFSLPQVVMTPHVAWLTSETIDRSLAIAVENCTRLRDGRTLLHEVLPRPPSQ